MASVKTIAFAYMSKSEVFEFENTPSEEESPLEILLRLEELAKQEKFESVFDFIRHVKLTQNSGEYDG